MRPWKSELLKIFNQTLYLSLYCALYYAEVGSELAPHLKVTQLQR